MENLLHILKLIKQTKCEKQAKLPSTLQSRYIQIHTYTHTNKLNTQAHAEMQTHTEQQEKNNVRRGKGAGRYTYTYTHTYSLINTVITSCGGQSAAARTGR